MTAFTTAIAVHTAYTAVWRTSARAYWSSSMWGWSGEAGQAWSGSRLARQVIFDRQPSPTISFVIEELGGREVMRGQLEEVLLRAQQSNLVVQVMPIGCVEHAALDGPFTLYETQKGQRLAYVEARNDSRLFSERKPVRE